MGACRERARLHMQRCWIRILVILTGIDPAVQIERLIRGLNPWPSAYTHWNDKVIKLWQADVVEDNTDQETGTIVKVEKDSFYVQTGEGLLKIEELQLQGKKRMDAGAFLRGNHLEYGEILKKC